LQQYDKKKQRSIYQKILLSFLISFTIISLTFSVTMYGFSKNLVEKYVIAQFENNLKAQVMGLERAIDSTVAQSAIQGDQSNYERLYQVLTSFREGTNIELAYVLVKNGEGETIVAVSGENDLRGAAYPFTSDMKEALNGTTMLSDIYEDEYGIHKSIFTQIKGLNAIIGIDMDASFIKRLMAQIIYTSIGITLAVIIAGFFIARRISKRISNPISQLVDYAKTIATGDFSKNAPEVTSKDEIWELSNSLNVMVDDLKEMIGQVASDSNKVATTSRQLFSSTEETSHAMSMITSSIAEVASGSNRQTSHVQEVNVAVNTISKSFNDIATSINDVTDRSQETLYTAEKGSEVVGGAIEQMDIVDKTVSEAKDVVIHLNDYAKQIEEIVTLITAISDQTNLLALNASIEAARAGEHGKGFAIVANEVRKLAEQSGSAASKISEKIDHMQKQSVHAVDTMTKGYHAVQTGMKTFNEAGTSFKDIRTSVNNVSMQIKSVKNKIEDINKGAESIVTAMEEVSSTVGQVNSNAQNVSAASEEQNAIIDEVVIASNTLSDMSQSLQEAIQKFKL
jgi:methyl-accepting chemotaxis protein